MSLRFTDHNDPIYLGFIESAEWDRLRRAAIKAQGARCRGCGNGRVTLDVHHLSYRRFGGDERPWDLLVVCRACHLRIHDLIRDQGFTLLQASETVALGAREQYMRRTVQPGDAPSARGGTELFRGVTVMRAPGKGHCIAVTTKGYQCGRRTVRNKFCASHDPDGKFRQQKREQWLQEREIPEGSRRRTYEQLVARRAARAARNADGAAPK